MFFTSTSRGLRMWFHVVGSDGLPRTNLLAGDFSATIINSTDTAVYTPVVTQSTQLAGMYRFDVPADFLTGSNGGVGDYAVSVIVDTFNGPSSGTNVRTTFSRVINVSSELFDSLSGSIWNATSGTFNTGGSFGRALNLAQISSSVTITQTNIDSFVTGVWNAANNTFNTSGTMGWLENRLAGISSSVAMNLDAAVSTRAVPGDQMTLTLATRGLIISGVWDERVNLHTVSGSAGDTLYSASNFVLVATPLTVDAITSGVWNAASGTFNTAGTMGRGLNLAQVSSSLTSDQVASGVWNSSNNAFNTSGTMGWLENRISHISSSVTINLDTPVSTRAVPGDQMSLTIGARALIVSGVWDERVNLHTTSGSAGDTLYSASNFVLVTTPPTVDAITSGVWNATSGTFSVGNTLGRALNLAQVSSSTATVDVAAVVSGVWNAANSTFNTSGTMGWLENRIADISSSISTNLDAAVSTRAVPGDAMSLTLSTRGLIISGVWDERVNLHTVSGSAGDTLYSASNAVSAASVDVPSIVSGVWNATLGTFDVAGTMGRGLNLAQISASLTSDQIVSGVWNAQNSTFNTSGTMGWLENRIAGISSSIATNLDIAVSTRAVPGDQMAITIGSRGLIISGVWDERVNLHTTSGSAGDTLYSASNIISTAVVDVPSIVSGVWNATNSTFNTSGTMGWLENRIAGISSSVATNLDVAMSTRAAPGDQMSLTIGTRGLIISGVWDERVNLHTTSGSAGDTLYSASNIASAVSVDVPSIVSGVWNATSGTFNSGGTFGRQLNLAAISASSSIDISAIVSGVWNATSGTFNANETMGRALNLSQATSSMILTQINIDSIVSGVWNSTNSTFNTSGTMGWLENHLADISSSVATNLDVAVSTRAVAGDAMALTVTTRGLIVSGVWDERVNLHTTSGSTGDTLYSASNIMTSTTAITTAEVVSGVWNAANGTFNTSGTMGWLENRISSKADAGAQMSLTATERGLIVSGVWDERINLHVTSGSAGDTLYSASNIASAVTVDVAAVVSGVWNATTSTFNTVGTMGRALNVASAGGVDYDLLVSGVWNATGFNTSGTMGWLQNKSSRISSSVEDVRNVEFGRWLISGSQHIFYDTSGNIIRTFNLFTSGGIPFYHDDDAVVERVPTN